MVIVRCRHCGADRKTMKQVACPVDFFEDDEHEPTYPVWIALLAVAVLYLTIIMVVLYGPSW